MARDDCAAAAAALETAGAVRRADCPIQIVSIFPTTSRKNNNSFWGARQNTHRGLGTPQSGNDPRRRRQILLVLPSGVGAGGDVARPHTHGDMRGGRRPQGDTLHLLPQTVVAVHAGDAVAAGGDNTAAAGRVEHAPHHRPH